MKIDNVMLVQIKDRQYSNDILLEITFSNYKTLVINLTESTQLLTLSGFQKKVEEK